MSKKIKLTEEQVKNLVNIISEENYDQALTTHQREKDREVFMSAEDAQLMSKLGTMWCEDKVNHPDCEALASIVKKLKIDRM
jgi:hypothetical protein